MRTTFGLFTFKLSKQHVEDKFAFKLWSPVPESVNLISLLHRPDSDIRFVVQIEADAESNFSLNLHNKSNVKRVSVQQKLNYYAESIECS